LFVTVTFTFTLIHVARCRYVYPYVYRLVVIYRTFTFPLHILRCWLVGYIPGLVARLVTHGCLRTRLRCGYPHVGCYRGSATAHGYVWLVTGYYTHVPTHTVYVHGWLGYVYVLRWLHLRLRYVVTFTVGLRLRLPTGYIPGWLIYRLPRVTHVWIYVWFTLITARLRTFPPHVTRLRYTTFATLLHVTRAVYVTFCRFTRYRLRVYRLLLDVHVVVVIPHVCVSPFRFVHVAIYYVGCSPHGCCCGYGTLRYTTPFTFVGWFPRCWFTGCCCYPLVCYVLITLRLLVTLRYVYVCVYVWFTLRWFCSRSRLRCPVVVRLLCVTIYHTFGLRWFTVVCSRLPVSHVPVYLRTTVADVRFYVYVYPLRLDVYDLPTHVDSLFVTTRCGWFDCYVDHVCCWLHVTLFTVTVVVVWLRYVTLRCYGYGWTLRYGYGYVAVVTHRGYVTVGCVCLFTFCTLRLQLTFPDVAVVCWLLIYVPAVYYAVTFDLLLLIVTFDCWFVVVVTDVDLPVGCCCSHSCWLLVVRCWLFVDFDLFALICCLDGRCCYDLIYTFYVPVPVVTFTLLYGYVTFVTHVPVYVGCYGCLHLRLYGYGCGWLRCCYVYVCPVVTLIYGYVWFDLLVVVYVGRLVGLRLRWLLRLVVDSFAATFGLVVLVTCVVVRWLDVTRLHLVAFPVTHTRLDTVWLVTHVTGHTLVVYGCDVYVTVLRLRLDTLRYVTHLVDCLHLRFTPHVWLRYGYTVGYGWFAVGWLVAGLHARSVYLRLRLRLLLPVTLLRLLLHTFAVGWLFPVTGCWTFGYLVAVPLPVGYTFTVTHVGLRLPVYGYTLPGYGYVVPGRWLPVYLLRLRLPDALRLTLRCCCSCSGPHIWFPLDVVGWFTFTRSCCDLVGYGYVDLTLPCGWFPTGLVGWLVLVAVTVTLVGLVYTFWLPTTRRCWLIHVYGSHGYGYVTLVGCWLSPTLRVGYTFTRTLRLVTLVYTFPVGYVTVVRYTFTFDLRSRLDVGRWLLVVCCPFGWLRLRSPRLHLVVYTLVLCYTVPFGRYYVYGWLRLLVVTFRWLLTLRLIYGYHTVTIYHVCYVVDLLRCCYIWTRSLIWFVVRMDSRLRLFTRLHVGRSRLLRLRCCGLLLFPVGYVCYVTLHVCWTLLLRCCYLHFTLLVYIPLRCSQLRCGWVTFPRLIYVGWLVVTVALRYVALRLDVWNTFVTLVTLPTFTFGWLPFTDAAHTFTRWLRSHTLRLRCTRLRLRLLLLRVVVRRCYVVVTFTFVTFVVDLVTVGRWFDCRLRLLVGLPRSRLRSRYVPVTITVTFTLVTLFPVTRLRSFPRLRSVTLDIGYVVVYLPVCYYVCTRYVGYVRWLRTHPFATLILVGYVCCYVGWFTFTGCWLDAGCYVYVCYVHTFTGCSRFTVVTFGCLVTRWLHVWFGCLVPTFTRLVVVTFTRSGCCPFVYVGYPTFTFWLRLRFWVVTTFITFTFTTFIPDFTHALLRLHGCLHSCGYTFAVGYLWLYVYGCCCTRSHTFPVVYVTVTVLLPDLDVTAVGYVPGYVTLRYVRLRFRLDVPVTVGWLFGFYVPGLLHLRCGCSRLRSHVCYTRCGWLRLRLPVYTRLVYRLRYAHGWILRLTFTLLDYGCYTFGYGYVGLRLRYGYTRLLLHLRFHVVGRCRSGSRLLRGYVGYTHVCTFAVTVTTFTVPVTFDLIADVVHVVGLVTLPRCVYVWLFPRLIYVPGYAHVVGYFTTVGSPPFRWFTVLYTLLVTLLVFIYGLFGPVTDLRLVTRSPRLLLALIAVDLRSPFIYLLRLDSLIPRLFDFTFPVPVYSHTFPFPVRLRCYVWLVVTFPRLVVWLLIAVVTLFTVTVVGRVPLRYVGYVDLVTGYVCGWLPTFGCYVYVTIYVDYVICVVVGWFILHYTVVTVWLLRLRLLQLLVTLLRFWFTHRLHVTVPHTFTLRLFPFGLILPLRLRLRLVTVGWLYVWLRTRLRLRVVTLRYVWFHVYVVWTTLIYGYGWLLPVYGCYGHFTVVAHVGWVTLHTVVTGWRSRLVTHTRLHSHTVGRCSPTHVVGCCCYVTFGYVDSRWLDLTPLRLRTPDGRSHTHTVTVWFCWFTLLFTFTVTFIPTRLVPVPARLLCCVWPRLRCTLPDVAPVTFPVVDLVATLVVAFTFTRFHILVAVLRLVYVGYGWFTFTRYVGYVYYDLRLRWVGHLHVGCPVTHLVVVTHLHTVTLHLRLHVVTLVDVCCCTFTLRLPRWLPDVCLRLLVAGCYCGYTRLRYTLRLRTRLRLRYISGWTFTFTGYVPGLLPHGCYRDVVYLRYGLDRLRLRYCGYTFCTLRYVGFLHIWLRLRLRWRYPTLNCTHALLVDVTVTQLRWTTRYGWLVTPPVCSVVIYIYVTVTHYSYGYLHYILHTLRYHTDTHGSHVYGCLVTRYRFPRLHFTFPRLVVTVPGWLRYAHHTFTRLRIYRFYDSVARPTVPHTVALTVTQVTVVYHGLPLILLPRLRLRVRVAVVRLPRLRVTFGYVRSFPFVVVHHGYALRLRLPTHHVGCSFGSPTRLRLHLHTTRFGPVLPVTVTHGCVTVYRTRLRLRLLRFTLHGYIITVAYTTRWTVGLRLVTLRLPTFDSRYVVGSRYVYGSGFCYGWLPRLGYGYGYGCCRLRWFTRYATLRYTFVTVSVTLPHVYVGRVTVAVTRLRLRLPHTGSFTVDTLVIYGYGYYIHAFTTYGYTRLRSTTVTVGYVPYGLRLPHRTFGSAVTGYVYVAGYTRSPVGWFTLVTRYVWFLYVATRLRLLHTRFIPHYTRLFGSRLLRLHTRLRLYYTFTYVPFVHTLLRLVVTLFPLFTRSHTLHTTRLVYRCWILHLVRCGLILRLRLLVTFIYLRTHRGSHTVWLRYARLLRTFWLRWLVVGCARFPTLCGSVTFTTFTRLRGYGCYGLDTFTVGCRLHTVCVAVAVTVYTDLRLRFHWLIYVDWFVTLVGYVTVRTLRLLLVVPGPVLPHILLRCYVTLDTFTVGCTVPTLRGYRYICDYVTPRWLYVYVPLVVTTVTFDLRCCWLDRLVTLRLRLRLRCYYTVVGYVARLVTLHVYTRICCCRTFVVTTTFGLRYGCWVGWFTTPHTRLPTVYVYVTVALRYTRLRYVYVTYVWFAVYVCWLRWLRLRLRLLPLVVVPVPVTLRSFTFALPFTTFRTFTCCYILGLLFRSRCYTFTFVTLVTLLRYVRLRLRLHVYPLLHGPGSHTTHTVPTLTGYLRFTFRLFPFDFTPAFPDSRILRLRLLRTICCWHLPLLLRLFGYVTGYVTFDFTDVPGYVRSLLHVTFTGWICPHTAGYGYVTVTLRIWTLFTTLVTFVTDGYTLRWTLHVTLFHGWTLITFTHCRLLRLIWSAFPTFTLDSRSRLRCCWLPFTHLHVTRLLPSLVTVYVYVYVYTFGYMRSRLPHVYVYTTFVPAGHVTLVTCVTVGFTRSVWFTVVDLRYVTLRLLVRLPVYTVYDLIYVARFARLRYVTFTLFTFTFDLPAIWFTVYVAFGCYHVCCVYDYVGCPICLLPRCYVCYVYVAFILVYVYVWFTFTFVAVLRLRWIWLRWLHGYTRYTLVGCSTHTFTHVGFTLHTFVYGCYTRLVWLPRFVGYVPRFGCPFTRYVVYTRCHTFPRLVTVTVVYIYAVTFAFTHTFIYHTTFGFTYTPRSTTVYHVVCYGSVTVVTFVTGSGYVPVYVRLRLRLPVVGFWLFTLRFPVTGWVGCTLHCTLVAVHITFCCYVTFTHARLLLPVYTVTVTFTRWLQFTRYATVTVTFTFYTVVVAVLHGYRLRLHTPARWFHILPDHRTFTVYGSFTHVWFSLRVWVGLRLRLRSVATRLFTHVYGWLRYYTLLHARCRFTRLPHRTFPVTVTVAAHGYRLRFCRFTPVYITRTHVTHTHTHVWFDLHTVVYVLHLHIHCGYVYVWLCYRFVPGYGYRLRSRLRYTTFGWFVGLVTLRLHLVWCVTRSLRCCGYYVGRLRLIYVYIATFTFTLRLDLRLRWLRLHARCVTFTRSFVCCGYWILHTVTFTILLIYVGYVPVGSFGCYVDLPGYGWFPILPVVDLLVDLVYVDSRLRCSTLLLLLTLRWFVGYVYVAFVVYVTVTRYVVVGWFYVCCLILLFVWFCCWHVTLPVGYVYVYVTGYVVDLTFHTFVGLVPRLPVTRSRLPHTFTLVCCCGYVRLVTHVTFTHTRWTHWFAVVRLITTRLLGYPILRLRYRTFTRLRYGYVWLRLPFAFDSRFTLHGCHTLQFTVTLPVYVTRFTRYVYVYRLRFTRLRVGWFCRLRSFTFDLRCVTGLRRYVYVTHRFTILRLVVTRTFTFVTVTLRSRLPLFDLLHITRFTLHVDLRLWLRTLLVTVGCPRWILHTHCYIPTLVTPRLFVTFVWFVVTVVVTLFDLRLIWFTFPVVVRLLICSPLFLHLIYGYVYTFPAVCLHLRCVPRYTTLIYGCCCYRLIYDLLRYVYVVVVTVTIYVVTVVDYVPRCYDLQTDVTLFPVCCWFTLLLIDSDLRCSGYVVVVTLLFDCRWCSYVVTLLITRCWLITAYDSRLVTLLKTLLSHFTLIWSLAISLWFYIPFGYPIHPFTLRLRCAYVRWTLRYRLLRLPVTFTVVTFGYGYIYVWTLRLRFPLRLRSRFDLRLVRLRYVRTFTLLRSSLHYVGYLDVGYYVTIPTFTLRCYVTFTICYVVVTFGYVTLFVTFERYVDLRLRWLRLRSPLFTLLLITFTLLRCLIWFPRWRYVTRCYGTLLHGYTFVTLRLRCYGLRLRYVRYVTVTLPVTLFPRCYDLFTLIWWTFICYDVTLLLLLIYDYVVTLVLLLFTFPFTFTLFPRCYGGYGYVALVIYRLRCSRCCCCWFVPVTILTFVTFDLMRCCCCCWLLRCSC